MPNKADVLGSWKTLCLARVFFEGCIGGLSLADSLPTVGLRKGLGVLGFRFTTVILHKSYVTTSSVSHVSLSPSLSLAHAQVEKLQTMPRPETLLPKPSNNPISLNSL